MIKTLLVFSFVLLVGAPAIAQEDVSPIANQVSMELSSEINSPFCPGKTLAMCTSPDAARVRRQIQQLAEDGKSKDEIKNTIIEEYGEEFRLIEPPRGDNFGVGIAVVAGLGLAFLAIFIVTRRRGDSDQNADEPEGSAPVDKQPEADDDASDPYLDELRQQYRD